MVISVIAAVAGTVAGVLLAKFFLLPLSLMPLALYEIIRTEGVKNTKPLALATLVLLVIQFLHTSKILLFPQKLMEPVLNLLPFTLPAKSDPIILISILMLAFFALLLIKYTWGSVTKFIAILLLLGASIQVYLFWPQLAYVAKSPFIQDLVETQKTNIKDNLRYRIEQELNF